MKYDTKNVFTLIKECERFLCDVEVIEELFAIQLRTFDPYLIQQSSLILSKISQKNQLAELLLKDSIFYQLADWLNSMTTTDDHVVIQNGVDLVKNITAHSNLHALCITAGLENPVTEMLDSDSLSKVEKKILLESLSKLEMSKRRNRKQTMSTHRSTILSQSMVNAEVTERQNSVLS